jgi:hypothetical protein
MKKGLVTLFILLAATLLNAQWVQYGFETANADTFFQHPPANPGLGTGSGSLILSDITSNPDPYNGTAACKVEWTVHSSESWGGFQQMMHLTPINGAHEYFDFSMANELRLWYYNVLPSTQPGLVHMRFKLHEAGGQSDYWNNQNDHEDWYFQVDGFYDAAPGWQMIVIPLVDLGAGSPTTTGFTLPGWSGQQNNGVLDFDKIIGYSLEFTTPGITNNGTANGVIVWDKLTLWGSKYTPLSTFDSNAGFFEVDNMGWAGATGMGNLVVSDMTNNPFEGAASLQFDATVNNSQSWGGYVNARHNIDGYWEDLSARTNLYVYIKVLTPFTGTDQRVTLRLMLFDDSDGAEEQWYHKVNVNLYQASEWQKIVIPLVNLEGTGDDGVLSSDGFRIPSWESYSGNNVLDLNKIKAWKFEFSGTGDFGPQGEVVSGSILVDLLQPAGFRETDNTPPDPPTGLLGVPSNFTNLVTWNDVANENGEKYDIYYSNVPNFSLETAEVVKLNVPENTQLIEHLLRAPGTDQSTTYYYAIVCTDKAGNVGQPAYLGSPITNTAKGVVTISQNPPANTFVADGNLTEWSSITPISMKLSDGSAFLVANQQISNDDDLSVLAYVAIDNQNLYVAFDVTDDIVSFDPTLASYYNDCPDLFIGLYDWHGKPHSSKQRGAQPDYQLRFAKDRVLVDGMNADSMAVPGANYFWGEKFPSGYTVEAKIPLVDLATKRNVGQTNFDSLFTPKLGMRIPIDFSINDADATGTREGIMCYSPYNEDHSYETPARWLYTWIGNAWTGVEDETISPNTYSLSQNYPNPFNPVTTIKYTLKDAGKVTLRVYDVLGRLVSTLVNDMQNQGSYTVNFDASNLASGMYIYKLESGSFQAVKKMMLLK